MVELLHTVMDGEVAVTRSFLPCRLPNKRVGVEELDPEVLLVMND